MSNKLYTEEQMHSAMLLALGRHGIYIPNNHYQDLIDLLTPIKLPTDEEIEEMVNYNPNFSHIAFGVKWLRDLILQGGNNEQ